MSGKPKLLHKRYELVRELGAGGMGCVYEGFDHQLKLHVAIKENLFDQHHRQAAFRREAQILAALRHPSLPRVIDCFQERGRQYLVMDLIEGDDLATIIKREKRPLAVPAVLEIALQLLDVLEYLHSQPIPVQHRDIKPSNLKEASGRIFLLDFGLAFGLASEMSTLIARDFDWDAHSSNYSSPEQMKGEPTSFASDIFSLAATLYTLLTAKAPPRASDRLKEITTLQPDPLKDLWLQMPELDGDLSETIMLGLSLEPHLRPQTAAQMRRQMFPGLYKPARAQPGLGSRIAAIVLTMICSCGIGLLISPGRAAICRRSQTVSLRRVLLCTSSQEVVSINPNIAADPTLPELRLRAEGFLHESKYPEARETAQEILAKWPDDPFARFIDGDANSDLLDGTPEQQDEMKKVKEQADRILALVVNPISAEDYTERGWANLIQRNVTEALSDANAALVLNPSSVAALMLRANATVMTSPSNRQRLDDALVDYQRVTTLRPNYAVAWANQAATQQSLGRHKAAVMSFKTAIRLLPKPDFYVAQAVSLRALGDNAAAEEAYRQALVANRRFSPAIDGLAELAANRGEWNTAIDYYKRSIDILPTERALYGRGEAYIQTHQIPTAIEDFTHVLNLNEKNYQARGLRAYCNAALEAWRFAVDDYSRALSDAPMSDRRFRHFVYENRAIAFRRVDAESSARDDERKAKQLAD